jgi:hypothetical protein
MSTISTTQRRQRWLVVGSLTFVAIVAVAGTWAITTRASTSGSHVTSPSTSTTPTTRGSAAGPSVAQDAQFLSEVSEADPALSNYERTSGNVALRSLLTTGSAFCAFLGRDRDMDTAMVAVVVGARQAEKESRLPMTVTTFNAVDAVALLTLCPSLQSVVPKSDMDKIRQLGVALTGPTS